MNKEILSQNRSLLKQLVNEQKTLKLRIKVLQKSNLGIHLESRQMKNNTSAIKLLEIYYNDNRINFRPIHVIESRISTVQKNLDLINQKINFLEEEVNPSRIILEDLYKQKHDTFNLLKKLEEEKWKTEFKINQLEKKTKTYLIEFHFHKKQSCIINSGEFNRFIAIQKAITLSKSLKDCTGYSVVI